MTKTAKIIIVGNGFGGTYALKNLHKFFHNHPKVGLSLVGEKNYFLFTPLLHEVATGGINPENIIEPIGKVLGCCLENFYLGKVESVNLKDRTISVADKILAYDYLILAPGAQTNFYNIPGASENCLTLKSIEDAIKIKNHCIAQMERASHIQDRQKRQNMLRFAVIGGGPTGVELAAELHEFITETFSNYYSKEIIEDASFVLIERGSTLMPAFGAKMRGKSLQVLKKRGVKVMLNTAVKEVGTSHILLDDNTNISAESIIWVAGIKPADLQFDLPVAKSADGKLLVNEYLQLESHPEVFALGDIASFKQNNAPLPALAQVAQKEARAVAENVQLSIKGKPLKPFFYHHSGNLISLGRWMAIGEIHNITFWGGISWWIWRTVYLSKLISFRKKVRVAFDWTANIFSPRDISQF